MKEENPQSLQELHQEIDDVVDEMSSRKYLSPLERDKLKRLKFERLAIKDRLERMRESSSTLS